MMKNNLQQFLDNVKHEMEEEHDPSGYSNTEAYQRNKNEVLWSFRFLKKSEINKEFFQLNEDKIYVLIEKDSKINYNSISEQSGVVRKLDKYKNNHNLRLTKLKYFNYVNKKYTYLMNLI